MATKIRRTPKKTGRPSKLTPELEAEIVELIKVGNYVETACGVVGIGKTTFYEWMKKANASVRFNRYVRFRNAVEKAQAWSEARDMAIISKASEKYWQAAAWKLERKFPEKFGRQKLEMEHTGKINANITHIEAMDRVVIKEALDIVAQSAKQEIKCEDSVDFV